MTVYHEIMSLRKGGDVMGAYERAMGVRAEEPSCQWVCNQIAWCLYDLLKANAHPDKCNEFLARLQEMADLIKERAIDTFIIKALVWPVRQFVVNCCAGDYAPDDVLSRTFGILQQIPFDTSDEAYSILLSAFVKAKKWIGLKQFIDWWGLENLKEKDCQPYRLDNGRSVMSLGEQAYIAYSKLLLAEIANRTAEEEQVLSFVEKLAVIAEKHPDFQYSGYFQAKLLLGVGHNDEAIAALMPFVKKKPKDFWVWDLLGDAEEDEDLSLSCYCKALTCRSKEVYLRKLHLKLCDLLIRRGLHNEAAAELAAAIAISKANGWSMPGHYREYGNEAWYLNTEKPADNVAFYKRQAAAAEQLTYADIPQRAIVITRIDREKQRINFVTADREEGYFPSKTMRCRVGDSYLCRLENNGGRRYTLHTHEPTDGDKAGLTRAFSGSLKIAVGGFGFVDSVFVAARLINGMSAGDTVEGKAIPSFDTKKASWGWSAYHLQKATD